MSHQKKHVQCSRLGLKRPQNAMSDRVGKSAPADDSVLAPSLSFSKPSLRFAPGPRVLSWKSRYPRDFGLCGTKHLNGRWFWAALLPDQEFEGLHLEILRQRGISQSRPIVDVKAMHDKTAGQLQQTCPNCKKRTMITPAKADEAKPRKHYCTECGHEWWESDTRAVQRNDSRGV
jgi:hypothetical protein